MIKLSEESEKLFKIIEPAMFNYPDKHYIDKALTGLEAHVKAEIRTVLERLTEQEELMLKNAYESLRAVPLSAIDYEIKSLEER